MFKTNLHYTVVEVDIHQSINSLKVELMSFILFVNSWLTLTITTGKKLNSCLININVMLSNAESNIDITVDDENNIDDAVQLLTDIVSKTMLSTYAIDNIASMTKALQTYKHAALLYVHQVKLKKTVDNECQHKMTCLVEDDNAYNYHTDTHYYATFCEVCGKQLTDVI